MPRLSNATTEEFRTETDALDHMAKTATKVHPLDDPAVARVSATIAILAVVGVILGSLESMETSASSDASSAALLAQTRAADAWAALDARMVRQALARLGPSATESAGTASPTGSPTIRDDGTSGDGDAPVRSLNQHDDASLARYARRQEQLAMRDLEEAERRGRRHHVLTWAVTLVQVAIAIATLSIIARPRRAPWLAGIGLGVLGALVGVWALFV